MQITLMYSCAYVQALSDPFILLIRSSPEVSRFMQIAKNDDNRFRVEALANVYCLLVNFSANGNYTLKTASKSPFALG